MSTKGFVYPVKEVREKIGLALRGQGDAPIEYSAVKDRILHSTRTVVGGTTTELGFYDYQPGNLNLDSFEKTKTLFAIPNAAVILGVAAFVRTKLTNAQWEALFYGASYSMQIQLGGEFITVDKGGLNFIASGGAFQPAVGADANSSYNNAFSDFRWYGYPKNKVVPPGENFQMAVRWPGGAPSLGSGVSVGLTLGLYAIEYKPIG